MLILKHVRNWSYEILEREVGAKVVYRSFCWVGMEKVPDAKTLVRLGQVIGAETIAELQDRIVTLAQERGVMRVDTTVVYQKVDSSEIEDGRIHFLLRYGVTSESPSTNFKQSRLKHFRQRDTSRVCHCAVARLEEPFCDSATNAS